MSKEARLKPPLEVSLLRSAGAWAHLPVCLPAVARLHPASVQAAPAAVSLHTAAAGGSVAEVQKLLDRGADVNAKDQVRVSRQVGGRRGGGALGHWVAWLKRPVADK